MAKEKNKIPIFPAETQTTVPAEQPADEKSIFPDMQAIQRHTAGSGEDPNEDNEAAVRAVCVRKCFIDNMLFKPGAVKYFVGPVPEHFRIQE